MSSASSTPNFDYASAVRYLFDRINYEKVGQKSYSQKNFRLARMHKLLSGLGDPHRKYPIVHIAGTKGKGSVAWLIAEAFRHAGKQVGLYTSPHLTKLEERFCINGHPCTADTLVTAVERVHPIEQRLAREGDGQCTFFELTTAIGFLLFLDSKVDVAVIEVGLGGRLDSTNVCTPTVSVLTSISFDHQQQLGDTIAAIAGEKAGIIKPKCPVVSGVLNPEAIPVIAKKATDCGCELRQAGKDFIAEPTQPSNILNREMDFDGFPYQYFDYNVLNSNWNCGHSRQALALRMLGKHQIQNAATAIAAIDMFCHQMNWPVDEAALAQSLAQTQVPARIQMLADKPTIILDSAHNIASIDALLSTLDTTYPRSQDKRRDRVFIFAASSDKEYEKLLKSLIPSTDKLIITQYFNNPRAVETNKLYDLALAIRKEFVDSRTATDPTADYLVSEIHRAKSPADALQLARRLSKPTDLICITGSFFLASEIMPYFGKIAPKG
jgi:dihydrofolate synthase/folylpolyglutamate synthase